MPSVNHLSTVTTFSDWSHADRVAIDDAEASAAWTAIQKIPLEDPQLRHPVASATIPKGWYGPHVSRYPPPPPPLPIPVPPRPINNTSDSQEIAIPEQTSYSSYVTPFYKPASNFNKDHYARRQSIDDPAESEEEFPSRNDPLTPRKMGGDVPYPYNSVGSFSSSGFEIQRDSIPVGGTYSMSGEYAPYPSSVSSSSSDNHSLKMSRRSGFVLSVESVPLLEYKNEQYPEYKYEAHDPVEVFVIITKINGRDIPKWIMGIVNSSDILPGWTASGERIHDIRYRVKYHHPQDPSTEIWGIFSDIEIRRFVPRLSNTPWPEEGTLLFVRSKMLDANEGMPRSTWFPCVCYDYGIIGLVGEYTNAIVPSDSRFKPCTEETLNEMRRDGSRVLFPWVDFEEFGKAIERPVFRR